MLFKKKDKELDAKIKEAEYEKERAQDYKKNLLNALDKIWAIDKRIQEVANIVDVFHKRLAKDISIDRCVDLLIIELDLAVINANKILDSESLAMMKCQIKNIFNVLNKYPNESIDVLECAELMEHYGKIIKNRYVGYDKECLK